MYSSLGAWCEIEQFLNELHAFWQTLKEKNVIMERQWLPLDMAKDWQKN